MVQRILKVLRHFTQICAYGAGRGSFLGPGTQLFFLSRSWFIDKIITVLDYKKFITEMSDAPDWLQCILTWTEHHPQPLPTTWLARRFLKVPPEPATWPGWQTGDRNTWAGPPLGVAVLCALWHPPSGMTYLKRDKRNIVISQGWCTQCPPNSSDRQDKYVISPICLISSRTEMSDIASNTMCTQSQTDISSVLWNDSPNRTECPMRFHKVSRTLHWPKYKRCTRSLYWWRFSFHTM